MTLPEIVAWVKSTLDVGRSARYQFDSPSANALMAVSVLIIIILQIMYLFGKVVHGSLGEHYNVVPTVVANQLIGLIS